MKVFAKTVVDTAEVQDIDVDNGYVRFKDGSHTRIEHCGFYIEVNRCDIDEITTIKMFLEGVKSCYGKNSKT